MNKIVIFSLTLLMAGFAPAMQQQRPQEPRQDQKQQQQQKKDKQKQKDPNNSGKDSGDKGTANPEIDDLQALLGGIMNHIEQTHGSVAGMVNNLKNKDHKRICPTCGELAETCPTDRERIAHGNIMTCGCPLCGGLQI